ncbi:MAG: hypothetical protein ACREQZ_07605 [Woeseiaceae bacterium]
MHYTIDSLLRIFVGGCCLAVGCALFCPQSLAQNLDGDDPSFDRRAEIVDYPAAFFEQYEPDTALDMVEQLPGFILDDGAYPGVRSSGQHQQDRTKIGALTRPFFTSS